MPPLMQLAEALKSPIVHALGGKEHVEYDNPYDVGMTGFIGFSSGYEAMHACDALLMLGTDFPYKQFFPTDAQGRAGRHPARRISGRRCKLDLGLVGDVGATHRGAAAAAQGQDADGGISTTASRTTRRRAKGSTSWRQGTPGRKPIHPQYLARLRQRAGVGRCRLHLRCRHADDLGRALSRR